MPLPSKSFTIQGGCNCQAIRYKISVPDFSDRPPNPYRNPGVDIGDLRIPLVAICHCNDCRRATASILPHVFIAELSTVQASLLESQVKDDESDPKNIPDHERTFSPASDLFAFPPNPILTSTYLTFYRSSPGRNRWFCSRCGTNIAYSVDNGVVPPEWSWPKMLDVWLGTVDREDLEHDYMSPERRLWCDMGVPWIRRLARWGVGEEAGRHPSSKIDVDFVEEE